MPHPLSVIRVCSVVGALFLCGLFAAEQKPSLIGATREQVLSQFGEPRSNMVAGSREILFYPRERIVLRNNVVVEVEPIEELPGPAPRPAPAPAKAAESADASLADATDPKRPASEHTDATPDGARTTDDVVANTELAPAAATPPPPEVQIKSVRPPSRTAATAQTTPPLPAASRGAPTPVPTLTPPTGTQPAVKTDPSAGGAVPAATVPAATPSASQTADVGQRKTEPAAEQPTPAASTTAPTATTDPSKIVTPPPPATPAETPASAATPGTGPARASAPAAVPAPERSLPWFPIAAGAAVLAAIVYVIVQRRQRALLLDATSVSETPIPSAPTVAVPATRFSADLLQKLEWKRFEELVCAYYNKTGVVAVRTKSGRTSPVHVKISWKGEQRPFACVHCVSHATGLVDDKPVEMLAAALSAEDVRRGYVVTSGKFSATAREAAEEKHITLLSGDTFLEKLNALPDPVRAEVMAEITKGDFTTPSCPTCETKMARSAADPTRWECPQCSTAAR